MGNVHMEAKDINYRGGQKKMSVEEALKNTSGEAAAIAQLQQDVSDLNDVKANKITIAPTFSAEASYDPGDLVYYNGLTYRCVNAHEGEWDADDFAATTIDGELAELRSGLTNLIVAEDRTLSFVNGKCEVTIPNDYILIAAIGASTLDYVAGFTLVSGTTGYALFLADSTATATRTYRLVYASKYTISQ